VAGSELNGGWVMEMGKERLPEGCDACPYGLCNPFDEQELVVRRWCYVPFETNDVGALCWESVDHPSESVNHRVRCIRCFRRYRRRVQLRLLVLVSIGALPILM
jgi:hypothetical protein